MSATLQCGACGAELRDAYLCNRCTTQLQADLLRASLAARDLRVTHLRQDVRGGRRTGKPSKAKYTPLPWSEHARQLLDDLKALLLRYCTPAAAGGEPVEKTALDLSKAPWLRQQETIGELANALPPILRRASAVIDRREESWVYGPCTTCGTLLEAGLTASQVVCPQCNTSYQAEKLRIAQWESVNESLVTQAEAAQLLHHRLGADTEKARLNINRWVNRRVIEDKAGYIRFGDAYDRWKKGENMRSKKALRNAQVESARTPHAA